MKISLLLISLAICCSHKCNDFKVLEATSQKWVGGIISAGSGINYQLTILTNQSSEKITIDQLWVGDQYFKVTAIKKFPASEKEGFEKGDTIYINARTTHPSDLRHETVQPISTVKKEGEPTHIKPSQASPFSYDGAALIGYELNKKRKFIIVGKIKKISPIAYP